MNLRIENLPKPPSVNMLYGRKGWRTFIKPEGQAWFEEAGYIVLSQLKSREAIKEPVGVKIWLFCCGRYDLDNCLKSSLDLLAKHMGVIENDDQVVKLELIKIKVKHRTEEKMHVEITTGNI